MRNDQFDDEIDTYFYPDLICNACGSEFGADSWEDYCEECRTVLCNLCEEEVDRGETGFLDAGRHEMEGVCSTCLDRYEQRKQDFLSEMESEFNELFVESGGMY